VHLIPLHPEKYPEKKDADGLCSLGKRERGDVSQSRQMTAQAAADLR
jgi:hypothetical protein